MEEKIEQVSLVYINAGITPTENNEVKPSIIDSVRNNQMDSRTRPSLKFMKATATKKAKRIRFFRNGDKFYSGVVVAVTPERYRCFDSLISDLTRALISNVTLPNGVRIIYTMDGKKVQDINDLEDGKSYVVSGQGEVFKKVEYSSSNVKRGNSLNGLPSSPAMNIRHGNSIFSIKAKIITLIRSGIKPRRIVRLLLNKRNSPSMEHVLEAITQVIKLHSGAARKVYALSGQQITLLEQFFDKEEIFIVYGFEKPNPEDFELDFEELKCVQSFYKGNFSIKKHHGSMPKMPARKIDNRLFSTIQTIIPGRFAINLPISLKLNYNIGSVIGDGSFAVVRQCVNKITGSCYAIKIIDKHKCKGKATILGREVSILRQVRHPNIISLIEEQENDDHLFLIMELMKGDLFDAITTATKFSEAEASIMIRDLCCALAYLHSRNIVHRDIKPENLLVQMHGQRIQLLKLADFGLAQIVDQPLYTICGTPTYVAPEILAEVGYGLKIDVWASGVILYILLCGFPPFVSADNEQEKLFEQILIGQFEFSSPYWNNISHSAKELISNMLQILPELRFSAEDVLDHSWILEANSHLDYQDSRNHCFSIGINSISY